MERMDVHCYRSEVQYVLTRYRLKTDAEVNAVDEMYHLPDDVLSLRHAAGEVSNDQPVD